MPEFSVHVHLSLSSTMRADKLGRVHFIYFNIFKAVGVGVYFLLEAHAAAVSHEVARHLEG